MTKHFRQLLFSFSLLAFSIYCAAQPAQKGGVPFGLANPEISKEISCSEHNPSITLKNFVEEDSFTEGKIGVPLRFGISIPVAVSVDNAETKKIDNIRVVWQKRIISDGAQAISLIFKHFTIPKNGKLFIYSPDGECIAGYFDWSNSTLGKPFVTRFFYGDEVIVEYSEEVQSPDQFASNASISVDEVVHAYRGFSRSEKDIGDSEYCEVNINCPEGNEWQTQKRGVAKLHFRKGDSWYSCSGSLVNNTAQDGTPYFLTADHCGGDASDEDRSVWQFYFNFERSSCENSAEPISNEFVAGCSLVARAPLSGGSDFQLVRITGSIPRTFLPYFNGWDKSNVASKNGVSIHHPAGDVKKISTYTRTLTTSTPSIGNVQMAIYSAWRVYWAETETNYGVTEQGSSGSPLFASSGLVVGTLAGGNSSCFNHASADYYGKFSYHWASNGAEENQLLQPWLDSEGLNLDILEGFDPLVPQNLSAQVDSKVVTLSWENPLITSDLNGFSIYEDGIFAQSVPFGTNSFSFDYGSKLSISYYITANYISPDYESNPSKSVTTTVETSAESLPRTSFVKIFPNPASNSFTVESELPLSQIRIYSAGGFMVSTIHEFEGKSVTVASGSLTKAFYLVEVCCENGYREVVKLVIK